MLVYLILILTLIYYYVNVKIKHSYWSKKGVRGPTPLPLFGNFISVLLMRKSGFELFKTIYTSHPDDKVVGVYKGTVPLLLVRDPEIVKHMFIKDFDIFNDRGLPIPNNPIFTNLVTVKGDSWYVLRNILSPTFTSKKIKDMIPLVKHCIDASLKYTENLITENNVQEIRSIDIKFTIDTIASCAFGVDSNIYSEQGKKFTTMANRITHFTLDRKICSAIDIFIPGFEKFAVNYLSNRGVDNFFVNLVRSVIKQREEQSMEPRNDFMDAMIKIKKQGTASKQIGNKISKIEVDDIFIASQAILFYTGGSNSVANTLAFVQYELALHQDIQERVYQELCEVYKKSNSFSYESLAELKYLRMVKSEAMRKNNITRLLWRKANADYKIPNTDIVIDKGTRVYVSAEGIQSDGKHFENPHKFDPERYSPENIKKIPSGVHLSFGIGPRQCSGQRFVDMVILLFLASFLMKFKLETSSKTKESIVLDPNNLGAISIDGISLKIINRG